MESSGRSYKLWGSSNKYIHLFHFLNYFLCLFIIKFKHFIFLTVASLVRKLKSQRREHIERRRPCLVEALNQMGDFYMELKWDFTSWGKVIFVLTKLSNY